MIVAKTKTSTEVKYRWIQANYKQYRVSLRIDDDADLIKFVDENKEKYGVTDIFRAGIEALMNSEKK